MASSLFLRALRICDPQHLDAELTFLRTSFSRLAYPKHVLDQALSQAKRTFYSGPRTRPERQPTLCLPFVEELQCLQGPLKKAGADLAFRQTNTLRRNLVRTSPPSERQVGAYAISCSSCPRQYIGETGAGLEKRISQHKYAIRCANDNNAIFVHMRDESHRPDWNTARLLHRSSDVHTRRLVEAATIKTVPNYNLKPGFVKIDNIMSDYICKLVPDLHHPYLNPPAPPDSP